MYSFFAIDYKDTKKNGIILAVNPQIMPIFVKLITQL